MEKGGISLVGILIVEQQSASKKLVAKQLFCIYNVSMKMIQSIYRMEMMEWQKICVVCWTTLRAKRQ